jgi:hypothetical protein
MIGGYYSVLKDESKEPFSVEMVNPGGIAYPNKKLP